MPRPLFSFLMFGWALRLTALIGLDLIFARPIAKIILGKVIMTPETMDSAVRLLSYGCDLLAVWTAGSLFVYANRRAILLIDGMTWTGLWLLAGAAPIVLNYAASIPGALKHGLASIVLEPDLLELGITTGIPALIGLVLLVAAKQGKVLRGQLDQFV